MIRLRPYKSEDSLLIAKWVESEDTFLKWGGLLFGNYPINAEIIDKKYREKNGDCEEPDNFYPWMAIDDEDRVVGHFIMRYIGGDKRVLRFGWVVVDDTIRGKGYGTQMLRTGLKFAFEVFGAKVVTLGVYESNDLAHNCYKKAGFTDREVVEKEPFNVIEMELKKEAYGERKSY
ncbi:MAG: GNAT family N-acetyltransferase [Lachnospiraceae bacterium]|nr:GNAT family N-acetyltransferase [Lachnospiraceae bacterium]MBP5702326.1 GNAT family N-acetyltransferase [Lachnospiraceae bacterium]